MLLGAIIGDMAGSRFEFERKPSFPDTVPLLSPLAHFTDDTVMTVAVAEGLENGYGNPAEGAAEVVRSMQKFGRAWPRAGYGPRFRKWLGSPDPAPYGSCGNGSAMRASAAAWLYGTLEEVERYSGIQAATTHDHPEGIRGATAAAGITFLARTGATKDEIRDAALNRWGYGAGSSLEDFRRTAHPSVLCADTLPVALASFLWSDSFEGTIRTAISFGADTDTQAAIAGSFAEAFYGVPKKFEWQARGKLPRDLSDALDRFQAFARHCGADGRAHE